MRAKAPFIVQLVRNAFLAIAGLSLAACVTVAPPSPHMAALGSIPSFSAGGTGKPYQIEGRRYVPKEQPRYDEVGVASWYGANGDKHNRQTADGEIFDSRMVTAAHKTLPLPCIVEVTNLANGRKLKVRVNDRGPFVDGRVLDMTKAAAIKLGFYGHGTARVRVRYLGMAPVTPPPGPRVYLADDDETAPPPRAGHAPRAAPAALAPPILGDQIDDRPLQASPSTVSWSTARAAKPAAKASLPSAPPQAASAPDIDSLLQQIADRSRSDLTNTR